MAKRNKNRHRPEGKRGIFHPTANLRLRALPDLLIRPVSRQRVDLRPFEDRRAFHPLKHARPAITTFKRADARLLIDDRKVDVKKPSRLPFGVTFAVPQRVAICVRRKRRKEVIFAKGVGGSKTRKPRRTEFSDVRC